MNHFSREKYSSNVRKKESAGSAKVIKGRHGGLVLSVRGRIPPQKRKTKTVGVD